MLESHLCHYYCRRYDGRLSVSQLNVCFIRIHWSLLQDLYQGCEACIDIIFHSFASSLSPW